MRKDETEALRRELQAELNHSLAHDRAEAEARHGRVWNTEELSSDFSVIGFAAPFVVVTRKSDQKRGSLEFQHHPRFYFNWQEE